jgi:hypothetical protein
MARIMARLCGLRNFASDGYFCNSRRPVRLADAGSPQIEHHVDLAQELTRLGTAHLRGVYLEVIAGWAHI